MLSFAILIIAVAALSILLLGVLGFFLFTYFGKQSGAQNVIHESLFLHHPDAMYYLDKQGYIKSANIAAGKMSQCQESELIGKDFSTLVDHIDSNRISELIRSVLTDGSKQFEFGISCESGQNAIISATTKPVVYKGKTEGICVFAKDITKYRFVDEERARLITILEATTDVVGTADVVGNVLYCNRAGRKLFGWELEGDISHHTIINCYSAETREYMFHAAIPTAMQHGVWSGEATIVNHEGREIPISQVIVAHKANDGSLAFLSNIARDITDRKRAEEALHAERTLLERRIAERTAELRAANAELARASRLKDEFLANMSHELRTPLNAILGLSEALQEGIYGVLESEQSNAIHSIEESGRHLLTLINDILDLSKIEAGQLTLNLDIVYVEDIGQASLRMIKQAAQQKQIAISSSFDSSVPILWADARRLKQVLVNLLSNAVKFTPRGGSIGIEVTGDQNQQQVYFNVWDTGIGIDKNDMVRLFQPFVQVDSSHTRQYEGTGLGLALVYRMVELHGGSITVNSVVGQGSRFSVALPWRVPEETDDVIAALARYEQRYSMSSSNIYGSKKNKTSVSSKPADVGVKILLAEDNAANIATFVDYLSAKGYQVIVAYNGLDALQRASEEHPSLILMDIQMPVMDGMEAIRRIRADSDLSSIPIIALTALAMDGDRERCLAIGANDYLSKPVGLQFLTEAITTQLRISGALTGAL